MFCKNCGANIRDDARFCESCGSKIEQVVEQAPVQEQTQQNYYSDPYHTAPAAQPVVEQAAPGSTQNVQDFLVGNIVLTVLSLLCCTCPSLITGIIGIVFSSMVKKAANPEEALQKAKTAKILFYVTLALTLLSIVVSIIMMIVYSANIMDTVINDAMFPYYD